MARWETDRLNSFETEGVLLFHCPTFEYSPLALIPIFRTRSLNCLFLLWEFPELVPSPSQANSLHDLSQLLHNPESAFTPISFHLPQLLPCMFCHPFDHFWLGSQTIPDCTLWQLFRTILSGPFLHNFWQQRGGWGCKSGSSNSHAPSSSFFCLQQRITIFLSCVAHSLVFFKSEVWWGGDLNFPMTTFIKRPSNHPQDH